MSSGVVRILGVDPGLRRTGYACLEVDGVGRGVGWRRGAGGGARVVEAGILKLRVGASVADRLVELDSDLGEVIERVGPVGVAVEKLFSHYRHPTTAAVMGHARGVILLAARRRGLALVELGATEVKKSITGHGHASKAQIAGAVAAQLGLACAPEPADVTDAIAIALCWAYRGVCCDGGGLEAKAGGGGTGMRVRGKRAGSLDG